jgi:hypothetical protein
MTRRLLFALAAVLLPLSAAKAQQANTTTEAAKAGPQEMQVAVPRSRIELYTGLRVNGDTDWMIGAQFLRRQPGWKQFGAAGFMELLFASDMTFMFGLLAQYYITPLLLVETGPGWAIDGGGDFLWRLGAEYELKMTKFSLSPKFYMDFVYGTTIFGFGVGFGLPR